MSIKPTKNNPHIYYLSLILYLAIGFTIILGFVVKTFDAGSACGSHWPACPNLLTTPNLNVFLEFGHRLATFIIGIMFLLQILLAIRSKLKDLYKWFILIGFLLALESIIGAIIVIFDLPEKDLNIFKLLLYLLHPLISVTLFASFGGICGELKQTDWVSLKLKWVFAVGVLAGSGSLHSLIIDQIQLYQPFHIRIDSELDSGILKNLLLIHPIISLILLFLAFRENEKYIRYSYLITFITGLTIPLFKAKILAVLHFGSFLFFIHTVIFSGNNKV